MDSVDKYIIFGPAAALKRLPLQLFDNLEPDYLYQYDSSTNDDIVHVAVYEEYKQQINAGITLTCIISLSGKKMRFELIQSGGRMGFRGSSLDKEKHTINDELVDFMVDFSKRHGLTFQQEQEKNEQAEEDNA
jgi:hypothetical protein